MQNILKINGLFKWCFTPLSQAPQMEVDQKTQIFVMSVLNNNSKHNALHIMKQFHGPHACWSHLKAWYEADNNPHKIHLIDKLFGNKKLPLVSMDDYLINMKETANTLEDVNVPLLEDIVVWVMIKNLPKEYDVIKSMILNEKLPSYHEVEMHSLNEECHWEFKTVRSRRIAKPCCHTRPQLDGHVNSVKKYLGRYHDGEIPY